MSRPAVFLDRDGTFIEERGYLDRLDLLQLFPFAADAIRLLNRAGYAVVVATNQSAIGRGVISEAFLQDVHHEIDRRLALGNARIDRYYYCPHHPDAGCDCRKPQPGLVQRACREMGLDPRRSVMIGDRWLDVACGAAAGTRGVLVRTGHGAFEAAAPGERRADAIVNNLMEATGWILRNSSR